MNVLPTTDIDFLWPCYLVSSLILFSLMLVMLFSVYCKSCEIAVVDAVFTQNVFIWIKTFPQWFILKISTNLIKGWKTLHGFLKSEQASHTCWLCKCYRKKWASYNKWQTTNSCRDIMINEILFQNIKHVWHLQSERNQRLKLKNLSYTITWNLSSLTAQNKQTGSSFQNLSKLRQKPVQMQLCGVFQPLVFHNKTIFWEYNFIEVPGKRVITHLKNVSIFYDIYFTFTFDK